MNGKGRVIVIDDEVNAAMQQVQDKIVVGTGWTIRK